LAVERSGRKHLELGELTRIRRKALSELADRHHVSAAIMADHLASFPPAIERIQREHANDSTTDPIILALWRLWWRFDLEFLSSELMCPPTGDEISDEPYFERL
jgi:hypothetical protein